MAQKDPIIPESWGNFDPGKPLTAGLKFPDPYKNVGIKKAPGSSFSLMDPKDTSMAPENLASDFMSEGLNLGVDAPTPDKAGAWLKPAEFGLSVVSTGLDIWNAFETSKMNDFMKDYYGDMMDLQKADFANAARSTNEELAARQSRRLDARGVLVGTEENKQQTSAYMDQWGVDEKV